SAMGKVGYLWGQRGKWNLSQEDGLDNSPIDAVLSFIDQSDAVVQVEFDDFANGVPEAATPTVARGVPVRRIATADGEVLVTTGFDLLIGQCGGGRGLDGGDPSGYDDENALFTPAWQERFTGIVRDTVLR